MVKALGIFHSDNCQIKILVSLLCLKLNSVPFSSKYPVRHIYSRIHYMDWKSEKVEESNCSSLALDKLLRIGIKRNHNRNCPWSVSACVCVSVCTFKHP